MGSQSSKEQRRQAIETIKDYVEKCGGNYGRHEASIGGSINGKEKHGIRTISVDIADEDVLVIIEKPTGLLNDITNTFTSGNATFTIIGKTLQIRPIDSLCGPIVIEVTAKRQ